MPEPTVSLVIPAHNAEPWIGECLASVRAQDYPTDRLEVIVVDNASTDRTAAICRDLGYPPLRCERPGASAARNAGIARARGEIVAFLDSDAVADPDWLSRLVGVFADASVGGAGGRIDPHRVVSGAEFHAYLTHLLDQSRHIAGKPPFMLPFVATANAAFRRSALEAVGGFDEGLSICEDADLCWRLQWAGHRIVYAPEARVRHHHRRDRRAYFRQVHHYGRGTVRLFAKHRGRLGRRVWIDWGHLGMLCLALLRVPIMPLVARQRWQRIAPLYDVAAGVAWTAGRIAESARRRVLVI